MSSFLNGDRDNHERRTNFNERSNPMKVKTNLKAGDGDRPPGSTGGSGGGRVK
jgi:hypothetical protein